MEPMDKDFHSSGTFMPTSETLPSSRSFQNPKGPKYLRGRMPDFRTQRLHSLWFIFRTL